MILVTGAAGHIGNVLVRELLARGEQVRALVLPGEDCASLVGLPLERVEGNVLDPASLDRALQGVSLVFHLAGVISISPGHDERVELVNVIGTMNLLDAIRRSSVRRLVYTGSIHAFQRVPHGILMDESLPFDPDNAIGEYDRSKARASLAVLEAARSGLDAVIVCPTGVIGPYDFHLSEMGCLVQLTLRSLIRFDIAGAYDFVDVRDVAAGLILAAEKGSAGEVYILSGEQIQMARLNALVQEQAGQHRLRIGLPGWLLRALARLTPWYYRLAHSRPLLTPYSIETVLGNSAVSSAKAQRELGYTARPLVDSIRDTVRWFQQNQNQV
jgi:dihydroflavonol-4-reductase